MKVLIIRFSSIGDIVLTTPVVRGLKEQLGAEVHYLTKRGFRNILEANPYIDRTWTIDRRVGEVLPALRAEQFDRVVDLHKNLRSLQVRLGLRKPWRAFHKLNFEKWVMVNLKRNILPDRHIVDRYLEPVLPLGVRYDGRGLDYFIPREEEVRLEAWAARFFSDPSIAAACATGRYIAFAIGAAHATKRLPAEQIIDICSRIKAPVVLLGGPADREVGERVAREAGGHVANTCGALSLHQSASVVEQSRHVITHDTGMMHIAAAFGKPITSIWGNTIPEFGMYPFFAEGQGRNTIVEVEGLACRPCSKIGHAHCPRGHFRCMREIDAGQVAGSAAADL